MHQGNELLEKAHVQVSDDNLYPHFCVCKTTLFSHIDTYYLYVKLLSNKVVDPNAFSP